MSDVLQVQKDRVIAAASKCGDAARVLRELFPEAFQKTEPVTLVLTREDAELIGYLMLRNIAIPKILREEGFQDIPQPDRLASNMARIADQFGEALKV